MFLALTPTMLQKDNCNDVPEAVDFVTSNLAAQPASYPFVSGDILGPVSAIEDEASVSQINGIFSEQNIVSPPPIGAMPTYSVSAPSVEKQLDNPILPAVQNDIQDTVATTVHTEFLSPATSLKRRLQNTKDLIVCPGVYDGFSARIALSVGFDALYMVSNIHL